MAARTTKQDWERGWTLRAEGPWVTAHVDPRPPCALCAGSGRREVEVDGVRRFGRCRCQMLPDRASLWNAARVPARHLHCTMDSFETRDPTRAGAEGGSAGAWAEVRRWLDDYRPGQDNRSLVLYGETGRGKTHLAVAACRELVFRHGVPVRFIEFTHLLSDIREGIGRGDPAATTLTPFIHPPVLVVDELGKGRNTEWEVSILDEIVSRRYNARGALFGTTNFKPKPPPGADPNRPRTHGDGVPLASMYLSERLGERAFSRLLETVTFVPALGDDHRLRLAANSRR